MHYIKYTEHLENTLAETYVEVDNDIAMRQISLMDNKIISSNIKDEYYHFSLCDQEINILDDPYTIITKDEFDAIWSTAMEKQLARWRMIKQKYMIGQKIIGAIEVFYPQDVIIEIEPGIWAAVDYDECKKSKFDGHLGPKRKVEGIITGYDEINMWIILNQVKVL